MSERQATVYRFHLISGIQNTWLRRILLLATFPLLALFNCAVATIQIVVFTAFYWWKNNTELCRSFKLRWTLPLEKEK